MRVKINIDDDVTPDLQRIIDKLADRTEIHDTAGTAVEVTLQRHFLELNKKKNQKEWKKQQFWARIRRATAMRSADSKKAIVSIADPAINLKVYGGTVKPKTAKRLSLPMIEEAYGKSPRVIRKELFYLRSKRGKEFLAARNDDGSVKLFYRLLKKTTHRPDPNALPTEERLSGAILKGVRSALEGIKRREAMA